MPVILRSHQMVSISSYQNLNTNSNCMVKWLIRDKAVVEVVEVVAEVVTNLAAQRRESKSFTNKCIIS